MKYFTIKEIAQKLKIKEIEVKYHISVLKIKKIMYTLDDLQKISYSKENLYKTHLPKYLIEHNIGNAEYYKKANKLDIKSTVLRVDGKKFALLTNEDVSKIQAEFDFKFKLEYHEEVATHPKKIHFVCKDRLALMQDISDINSQLGLSVKQFYQFLGTVNPLERNKQSQYFPKFLKALVENIDKNMYYLLNYFNNDAVNQYCMQNNIELGNYRKEYVKIDTKEILLKKLSSIQYVSENDIQNAKNDLNFLRELVNHFSKFPAYSYLKDFKLEDDQDEFEDQDIEFGNFLRSNMQTDLEAKQEVKQEVKQETSIVKFENKNKDNNVEIVFNNHFQKHEHPLFNQKKLLFNFLDNGYELGFDLNDLALLFDKFNIPIQNIIKFYIDQLKNKADLIAK